MKKTMIYFLLMLFVFTILITGCKLSADEDQTLGELAAVEIKEYQGVDLSSLLDFRENSIKGPQTVDIGQYRLTVDGLVKNPMTYSYDEVLTNKKYEKKVTLHCVEGWSVDILWEGVLLNDLFEKAGVSEKATTVIFYAVDGYTTSLSMEDIRYKNMMIAYKMNGVVLPPERGYPFQLVAEDKLGYKWIKWLTRIELSDNEDFRGTWEKVGYSNEAHIEP